MKVIYKGKVIAESNEVVKIEGNYYFPVNSIDPMYLEKSELKTTCFWKGEANYYNLNIDGSSIENGAWYYPEPSDEAKSIKNKIAFYKRDGLKVKM